MRIHLITAVITGLLMASGQPMSAAPPSFQSREVLELNNAVIALGDFNKDGRSDIAAAMLTPNSSNNDYEVVINLNMGNGVFQPGRTIDLGPNFVPTAMATADFNGDGLLDFLVYSSNAQAIYVAIQLPNKSYEIVPIQVTEVAYPPVQMAVGDLNRDGRPDIVIPTYSGAVVILNQGNGRFSTPALFPTQSIGYVTIADINGDKNPDLVVGASQCCFYPSVVVLLGDGQGNFLAAPQSAPFFDTTGPIAVGDFNQDGTLDVATVSTFYNPIVAIGYGGGDGSFPTTSAVTLPNQFTSGLSIAAGDLNHDGIPDLCVLAGSNGSDTSVFSVLGTGGGAFSVSVPYPVQATANYLQLGAVNSDKLPDVFVSSTGTTQAVSLLVNTGGGVYQDGQLVTTPGSVIYMQPGDFNNDQKLDLVAIISGSGLTGLINNGTSSLFTPLTPLPFYSGPLAVGDFNNDGREDLVIANQATGQTLLGRGDGTFLYQPPTFNIGYTPGKMVAADMNNDGKLDLVTNTPAIALGKGNGTFQAAVSGANPCYYPNQALAVADLNGDGKPDVVNVCYGSLYTNLGNGDGTLQFPTFLPVGYNIQSVAVGDFNRDGIADIVFTSNPNFYPPVSTEATILLGLGNGTFQTGQTVLVPTGSLGLVVAQDFNGDGITDVAVLDDANSVVSVLQGNGDGTFLAPVSFGTGTSPTCMVAGRFRPNAAKGKPDLAFCAAQGISVLLNTTP